ncbi:hypothetical protein IWW38_004103, partial [Coemansia aciculifera]
VYLHNPYYFMYATLMDEIGERELNTLNDKKARSMTGSVVASLAHLKDIDGSDGAFFVFPDLSVRCEGVYRLKFSLFEIVGNQIFFCKSIMSTTFTVYSAKKFPGMEESTRLTKLFAEQGLKIRVRKEQKSTRPKGARSRPIATTLPSDGASSVHGAHPPPWGSDHRSPASASTAHANPPSRHLDRQAYPNVSMPSISSSMGSAALASGSAASGPLLQRATSPPGPWSSAAVHRSHNSSSALSQSPPLQPSVSQYASIHRNPESEAAGHQHFRQQQHSARRGASPNFYHPPYRGHQQTTSYTHHAANALSSPTMDSGNSAFVAPQPDSRHLPPVSQRYPAPQSQYQPQPQPQHLHHHHASSLLPRSGHGSSSSRQALHSSDHRLQQSYRHAPVPEDDNRPSHHQYGQRRPWSPHHPQQQQQQQQHYSPAHIGHGFGSEPRYSPYARQVEGHRQHLSPGPSTRAAGSFVSPNVSDATLTYYEQPSFRHQQHASPPVRAQQADNLQYYHLASSQRTAQHISAPPLASKSAAAPASSMAAVLPSPAFNSRPPQSQVAESPTLLESTTEAQSPPDPAPSQQHRIAVHSLLISTNSPSASPEKASGSP